MSIEKQRLDKEAPDSVMIKSKKDLKEKLQKGIDDINSNKLYSVEEVFDEIDMVYSKNYYWQKT